MLQRQLHHKYIESTNLKYQSYNSPTSTDILWGAGQNVLTSAIGYAELRPGFSPLEPTPTTFSGTLKRIFGWRRWGGNFYVMLCEVDVVAKVYKLASGVDSSFSLIFTSASSEPFDFVVSNNFCFFGNGKDMKKFDGTTVTNWGIAPPTSASVAANAFSGLSSGSPAWSNPGNVVNLDSAYATNALTVTLHKPFIQTVSTGELIVSFTPSLPAGSSITGIVIEVSETQFDFPFGGVILATGMSLDAQLIKNGINVGQKKTVANGRNNSFQYHAAGSQSDLWGATWNSSDAFGVSLVGSASWLLTSGTASTVNFSLDHVRITIFVSNPVTNAPTTSLSGTGINATAGYRYVYCYSNSVTGHQSSPSASSVSTGVFSNKTVNVAVVASSDPQVDRIRLYRTTDGGDGKFFELPTSPFPNASANIADANPDSSLSTVTAPTPGFNDPPPAAKGFVWYANRIWMIVGNLVWMTGWEEINNGVGEECVPSGGAGNFWAFANEATGLSRTDDGVYVFTAETIYKISGDSLDTFYRGTYADNLGARQRAAICRLGKITAWLDSSNSVWGTNANTIEEIATPIRPDISAINHSGSAMTFYINKTYRWMTLLDGSRLFNFDLDGQQWMLPWPVSANCIANCETSAGVWDLLIGSSAGRVLKLDPTVFTDDGVGYSSALTSNLFNLTPAEAQPDRMGTLEYLSIENNGVDPSKVEYLIDENPAVAAMTDVTAAKIDVPLRTQGTTIRNVQYGIRKPPGRRCSFRLTWDAGSPYWRLYTFDLAMQEFGK